LNTCEYAGTPFTELRSHPWIDAVDNPECRYYDLTLSPERIRTSLEDFLPWSNYKAIENFYKMLEDLNQSKSFFESNDCALTGPEQNHNPQFQKSLECSGRVMILFRDLIKNTMDDNIEWLAYQLHCYLSIQDIEFQLGVIGTTITPVRYLALGENDEQQMGTQLMISFWTWGDNEKEIMENLNRLIINLSNALHHVSDLIIAE